MQKIILQKAELGNKRREEVEKESPAAAMLTKEKTTRVKKKDNYKKEEFERSRRKELEGLLRNGTFAAVSKMEVQKKFRIFGSKFIDEIKKAGEGLRLNGRLVAQNYSDEAATTIETWTPITQRDIIQENMQSDRYLEREIFISPSHQRFNSQRGPS